MGAGTTYNVALVGLELSDLLASASLSAGIKGMCTVHRLVLAVMYSTPKCQRILSRIQNITPCPFESLYVVSLAHSNSVYAETTSTVGKTIKAHPLL